MQRHDQINRAARFLPQTTDDEVPAISVGGALVAVYWTAEHQLRVSIGTRDGHTDHYAGNDEDDDEPDESTDNPPMQVTLHEATIYQIPAAPAPSAVARLDDAELFAQLALSEYTELHGGAGLDYPVDALAAEIERRIPGSLDRVAAHLHRSTPAEAVRAWMTQPDTLLAIARAEPTPVEAHPEPRYTTCTACYRPVDRHQPHRVRADTCETHDGQGSVQVLAHSVIAIRHAFCPPDPAGQ